MSSIFLYLLQTAHQTDSRGQAQSSQKMQKNYSQQILVTSLHTVKTDTNIIIALLVYNTKQHKNCTRKIIIVDQ